MMMTRRVKPAVFRQPIALVAALLVTLGFNLARADAQSLKAGAGVKQLTTDDAQVIGGGILPGKLHGQEGELRASALVVEDSAGQRVALVACDVLMIERDMLDDAAHRIETATGIPFDHILINATHTHHAPTTVTIHGYKRDENFTRHVADQIVAATVLATKRLTSVTCRFQLGEESSVGKNSRLLLSDGTIFWIGTNSDVVRPTGPFDPELPVMAFERPDHRLEAVVFNHSTHTIGTQQPGVRSPSFYGLAAQTLEKQHGGTFLFFEGASGSTHNLDLKIPEATTRIMASVVSSLDTARPLSIAAVRALRKEITVKFRTFSEAADDQAVSLYCNKRVLDPKAASAIVNVFRDMRKQVAPLQGTQRKTWVQAVLIGDVAFVGVPGEFFTVLGQEIKRQSPFRYTYIFELANDYIGYIPDKAGFDLGGYQVWTGLHSYLERGTGERIVAESVGLLERLAQGSKASSPVPAKNIRQ